MSDAKKPIKRKRDEDNGDGKQDKKAKADVEKKNTESKKKKESKEPKDVPEAMLAKYRYCNEISEAVEAVFSELDVGWPTRAETRSIRESMLCNKCPKCSGESVMRGDPKAAGMGFFCTRTAILSCAEDHFWFPWSKTWMTRAQAEKHGLLGDEERCRAPSVALFYGPRLYLKVAKDALTVHQEQFKKAALDIKSLGKSQNTQDNIATARAVAKKWNKEGEQKA